MNQERCLITFIKYPKKGKVKSRLVLGDDSHVADLYRCFIEDLFERVSSGDYRFLIAFDPPEKEKDFAELFGKDFYYMPQTGADLGKRMHNAFISCFAEGFQSVVIIGSDSPDLPREIIEEAFESLKSYGAVIGPTYDGGYYLIGFSKDSFSEVFFESIVWSTDSVYTETIRRFDREGISFHVLPRWRDIDTVNDLKALLKDCENSDFSRSKTVKFLKDKGFAAG
jgi:rSAM/selenodomain-associated transferase 1